MTALVLDAEQERDAQRIASEPTRAALDASTMSAGKTVVALRVAALLEAKVIVVCGPLQTRGGWQGTAVNGWVTPDGTYEDLSDLPFHWIRNHKQGKHAIGLLMFNTPGIYFVGHQYAVELSWDVAGYKTLREPSGEPKRDPKTGEIRKKVVKKRNTFWDKINPDLLIVDEIHKGSINQSALTWKTLDHMQAGFTLGLSGTAMGNRFDGIYPVTKLLWPDHVDRDLKAFKVRWCIYKYDPHGWDHMKVTGEKDEGAYFRWLPCVVRRIWEYEGVVDSDEVHVSLSAEQRKAYNDLERSMVTWLEDHPFVIDFPQTLRIRLRQATLAMFYVDDDDVVNFREDAKSAKLDALFKILEKDFEGETAIILTDSNKFARITVARINKIYGDGAAEMWSGSQSQTVREETKARFIGNTTRYVVMVIKAGGTGTDGLQFATRNIVVMSQDDSRIENEQAIARTSRRGQGALVRLRYVIADDTDDEGILHGQLDATVRMRKSMDLTVSMP
jgi:superfamily II DNA or RNA helicase